MAVHAFVDESKRGRLYLVSVAVARPAQLGPLRKSMRGLLLPGQRELHFHSEKPQRRRTIADAVARLPTEVTIYTKTCRTRNDEPTREACIAQMTQDLLRRGARRLVIDSRQERDRLDRRTIRATLIGQPGGADLVYEHVDSASESLLWIADAASPQQSARSWTWTDQGAPRPAQSPAACRPAGGSGSLRRTIALRVISLQRRVAPRLVPHGDPHTVKGQRTTWSFLGGTPCHALPRQPSATVAHVGAESEVLPPLRAVTADQDLFSVVRDWARDSIRPVPVPTGWTGADETLLVKAPAPWASVVAFAVRNRHELRPLLVLKNVVALWAVHRDLPDGIVGSADWLWLRHLCLLHNPGLDGALTVIGQAVR